MIDEMTGQGGWGLLDLVTGSGGTRPVVVSDAGYGECADFRLELETRGWRYVIAVKGSVSGRPHDAAPAAGPYGGPGPPRGPPHPAPPATLPHRPPPRPRHLQPTA